MLDGAIHTDEHRIQEASNKRFRKELLQAHGQLCQSVFGKTMENVQKLVDIKIVRSDDPLFAGCTQFSNNLAGFSMHKESVKLDKLVYKAMTILDNRKILMYDFYYNTLKKQYGARSELIYTQIQTAFCWKYKLTMCTRIWKAANICTTQAIIPKITRFIAPQTKKFWAR